LLTHKGTQIIKIDNIVLRPFTMDDAEAMFKNWANDARVTQYLTWEPHKDLEVTKAILSQWVEQYPSADYYQWAIDINSEAIGSMSVINISDIHSRGAIGYCLGYEFWNKGIMTKTLKSVIDFMFAEVGINKLYAFHDIRNLASGRVLEKCGMVEEGILREEIRYSDGSYGDVRNLSILRKEWETART
jgi:ribosomal-protein-alanine N-acetyltransferase